MGDPSDQIAQRGHLIGLHQFDLYLAEFPVLLLERLVNRLLFSRLCQCQFLQRVVSLELSLCFAARLCAFFKALRLAFPGAFLFCQCLGLRELFPQILMRACKNLREVNRHRHHQCERAVNVWENEHRAVDNAQCHQPLVHIAHDENQHPDAHDARAGPLLEKGAKNMRQGFGIGHQQKCVIHIDIQGPHKKPERATNAGKHLKRSVEPALKKVADKPELKHPRANQCQLEQRIDIKSCVRIPRQRSPYRQQNQARHTRRQQGTIEVLAVARREQKEHEMRERNAQWDR